MALYEIARQGLQADEGAPYRGTFTQIETDEGITGLSYGGTVETKALGRAADRRRPDPRGVPLGEAVPGGVPPAADRESGGAGPLPLGHHRQGEERAGLPAAGRPDARSGARVCRACSASRRSRSGPPSARSEFVEQGFTALKWYLPFNERAGKEGLRRNVALVKAVREAVGPDIDIMVDCLLSDPKPNSILYVIDLARRLEEYTPTWLEEPLNFDDLDAHAKLAASTRIPLAFGEHFYTRWQIRQIIESGAATVFQPDAERGRRHHRDAEDRDAGLDLRAARWCRTPTSRVGTTCTCCSPTRSGPARSASGAARSTPTSSGSTRTGTSRRTATIEPPAGPGFGYELDESKIRRRAELA